MVSVLCVTTAYLVTLTSVIQIVSSQSSEQEAPTGTQFLREIPGFRPDLSSLGDTLQTLDGDLALYQKRTCALGISNHHCALMDLDRIMASSEWLKSGHSPGKRSSQIQDPATLAKYEKILDDIVMKRKHLAILKDLLEDARGRVIEKRKRSCLFDIGGQCRTELASAIADQYYYLNGGSSPGKRRKRSRQAFGKLRKSS